MNEIRYIDRQSRQEKTEQVYGKYFLTALYGSSFYSRILSFIFLPIFSHLKFLSRLYGAIQKSSFSRFKVKRFVKKFKIDTSEFLDPIESFNSFNDFFIRKLKPSARPISSGHDVAILPADARYLVYENIYTVEGFWIKGHKFSLEELVQDAALAAKYTQGSMVIARLAPVDYHRFHFPANCLSNEPKAIPGPLYSVNPIALKSDIHILSRNKRMITTLNTKNFGSILYIEVGATNVGSIHQTFIPHEHYAKGDEKGFFSFGGSCIILLFEPYKIQFDQDLIDASHRKIETLGLFGQSLGRALSPL
jgi:phosphatidylserine decarboxylase